MTSRFIVKVQVQIIQNTLFHLDRIVVEQFSQTVHLFLRNFTINDHNRVIQIPAFDQIVLQKHFQLAQEHECPTRGNLFRKIGYFFRISSILHLQVRRIVSNDQIYIIVGVRQ